MKFDLVYESVGTFGRYQKYVLFLSGINSIYVGLLFLGQVFLLAVPSHRCAIPGYSNDTFAVQNLRHQELINKTIPLHDACNVFPPYVAYDSDNRPINASVTVCDNWVYDDSIHESTLGAKLNLVCDRKIFKSNAQMIFFAGVLVGSFVSGVLSDRFGRRPVCCVVTTLAIGASLAIAWTPNFVYYVIFTFCVGFLAISNYMCCFVLCMEFVGPHKRKYAGMINEYFWMVGNLLLALLGYCIRNWFYLQLACALPGVLYMINWWLLPESPRWLYSRGRYEEAETIIQNIAKYNKTTLPDGFFKKIIKDGADTNDEQTGRIWQMFSTRRLTIRTLVIFANWIVVCMTYFGLTLSSGNLGGTIFFNFAMNALADIPGNILTLLLLDRIGRKPLFVTCMIVGGVACLSTIFSTKYGGNDLQPLTITLALIGKTGSMAGFATIFVYSAELYPTTVRNAGMGASSCMARIGGMIAPYIADLGNLIPSSFGKALPMVIFGTTSIIGGLLALILPETLNMPLPETIADAQNFGREPSLDSKEPGHDNKAFGIEPFPEDENSNSIRL